MLCVQMGDECEGVCVLYETDAETEGERKRKKRGEATARDDK
jgi:hypothetical protein